MDGEGTGALFRGPVTKEEDIAMMSIPGTCPQCGGIVSVRKPLEQDLSRGAGARVWACGAYCTTIEPDSQPRTA